MEAVIFPAYNEEKNIRFVIREARKYLDNPLIVVVDDGSKDRTSQLAKGEKAIVLRHERNKGKGEAVKTGIKFILKNHPNVDVLILADSDRQYLLEDAPKLSTPIKEGKADIVVGARNWREVPFRHRLGNFIWRKTFNFLFKTGFRDTNCGYMALNRKGAKLLLKHIYGGYILENSILIGCLKSKLKIVQKPVRVVYKRKSGIRRGVRMVLGVLIFIIKEGLKYRTLKLRAKI